MIGVIAKLKVKAGMGPAFAAQVARMSRTVETAEPGNVFYRGYHTEHPDRFVALEVYRDRAALDAHGKSPHVAAAMPEVGQMLDGDLSVEVLEQVW